jgi:hypothetical protein
LPNSIFPSFCFSRHGVLAKRRVQAVIDAKVVAMEAETDHDERRRSADRLANHLREHYEGTTPMPMHWVVLAISQVAPFDTIGVAFDSAPHFFAHSHNLLLTFYVYMMDAHV